MITIFSKMSFSNLWLRVAGLSGASAVGLGAIGAHAMLKQTEAMKEVWKVRHN